MGEGARRCWVRRLVLLVLGVEVLMGTMCLHRMNMSGNMVSHEHLERLSDVQ